MNIVHLAFECAPIYKTGGLGDVVGSLPKALSHLGVSSKVIMPGYGWIEKPATLPNSAIPVEYLNHPWFGKREMLKDPKKTAPAFALFCLQVLQQLKSSHQAPDIIHCHDWHTALVPFLLKKWQDPFFSKTKTVLTIHNIAFKGNFLTSYLDQPELIDLTKHFPKKKKISFLVLGIKSADMVTTVSPHHAKEIKTGIASFGIKYAFKNLDQKFIGIINGIDNDVWNPTTDPHIYKKYHQHDVLAGKNINKIKLQQDLGLLVNEDIPLFGFVARLTTQKGIDFLIPLMEAASLKRIEIVVLGTGDKKIEATLKQFQNQVADAWVSVNLLFDEKLAHRIYAASNFFLMPSRFEPCGLTQMIAMRYGTLPIASNAGGLKDTIIDGATGWMTPKLTEELFMQKVNSAIETYVDRDKYLSMVKRVMREDFSWDQSARKYIEVYKDLLK